MAGKPLGMDREKCFVFIGEKFMKKLFFLLSLILTPIHAFCDETKETLEELTQEIGDDQDLIENKEITDDEGLEDLETLLFGEPIKFPTPEEVEAERPERENSLSFSSKVKIFWILAKKHVGDNFKIYALGSIGIILLSASGIVYLIKRKKSK